MDLHKQKIINLFKLPILPYIISFVYFFLASIYITYPLIFRMADLAVEKVDVFYVSWIINWDIYSFTHNIFNIFNTNIFYPYHNTLAYSETFITSAIISFLPVKIFGEPLVAYNFVFIFSLLTLSFFTYMLTYYLTKNHIASIVSGTLASFSPYTLSKYMHIQLLNICWVPLAILYFLKFLDSKRYKYLVISAIFFVIQVYNSFLPGYFIAFSCFFIFISYLMKRRIKLNQIISIKVFVLVIFVFMLIMPIISPYYQVSKEFNYARDIRESIHNANRPEYTLYPGNTTRLGSFLINTFYKNDKGLFTYDGFIGLMFFLLAFLAVIYRFFHKKIKSLLFDVFLAIGIFGYVLSLGPAFQWGRHIVKQPFIIPLPYALFYYLIPGFNGLRNSARWEMLFLFAISICIGIFLSNYFKNKSKHFIFLMSTLICLLVILEFKFPYNYYKISTVEQFPKIYSYIHTLPKNSVIAQFPIFNWDTFIDGPYLENLREYYYTLSYPITINGTAGFDPPPWQEKIRYLIKTFPSNSSIDLLRDMRVNYIIVNEKEYDQIVGKKDIIDNKVFQSGQQIINILSSSRNVKLIKIVDDAYVYKIN